jgi:hypothetical protein
VGRLGAGALPLLARLVREAQCFALRGGAGCVADLLATALPRLGREQRVPARLRRRWGNDPVRSQREIPDLAVKIALLAAFHDEKKVIDGPAHRQIVWHFDDAGHRQTSRDALVGVAGHRRNIVGQDNTPVGGRLL